MYIKMNKFIYVILLMITTSLFSIDKYVDIQMIKHAGEPLFTPQGIVITLPADIGYQPFLRTDMDGWSQSHYFETSFYGVYYCVLGYDYSKSRILYRINVNGFWEVNKCASETITDNYGNEFCVIEIPDEVKYLRKTPIENAGNDGSKRMLFRFYKPDVSQVNLVCSNSGFSRFANSMRRDANGYWEIELVLGKGNYAYYFVADNKKYLDIDNLQKVYDPDLGALSAITIK